MVNIVVTKLGSTAKTYGAGLQTEIDATPSKFDQEKLFGFYGGKGVETQKLSPWPFNEQDCVQWAHACVGSGRSLRRQRQDCLVKVGRSPSTIAATRFRARRCHS